MFVAPRAEPGKMFIGVLFAGAPAMATRIPVADIDTRLEEAEAAITGQGLTRVEIADRVAGAFANGRCREAVDQASLLLMLFWLAMRGDATVARQARAGAVLIWHVTPLNDGPWSLALQVDDAETGVAISAKPAAPAPHSHDSKIGAAVEALRAGGALPHTLRAKERDARVLAEMRRQGHASAEMPSRRTIRRWFARHRC
jgi:hypothetical protein